MRARRHGRPHCARCGGPKRHPSDASINCRECGDLVCLKHAISDPDTGGWVCTKCVRDQHKQGR